MGVSRRILVPIDFSLQSRGALQYGLVLGQALEARIDVLHVCSEAEHIERHGDVAEAKAGSAADLEAATRAESEDRLEAFLAEIEVPPEVEVAPEVTFDDPLEAIVARAEGAHLVVMGTHGRQGLERLVMGSLTSKVLRKVEAPVVTYRWPKAAPLPRPGVPKRLLVPVDFSDGSRAAFERAAALAEACGAAIDVLNVVHQLSAVEGAEMVVRAEGDSNLPFERWTRTRGLDELEVFLSRARGHDRAELRVEVGEPAEAIIEAARLEGYDLVVMGTHGRSGLERWMVGSVAERVAREAPCPVMTCRHQEDGGP